jgi:hypothetical protein
VNGTTRDIPWTGTGGISDTQSYSWIILNAIYDRISQSTFFQNFAVKRITRALPIEAGYQIPSIGIYLGSERAVADGDPNAGDIRLQHTIPVGMQIVVKNNDPVAMQATLDQAKWFILNQLLRDNTFTNRLKTTIPDNVRIEGFPQLRIPSPDWGRDSKNETPIGIQLIELTYTLRTEWYPTNFDDLKEIAVTAYPEVAPPVTTASGTGTASGINLTMTGVAGTIEINATISGTGVPVGTTITAQQSGTTGGNGVYTTSVITTAAAAALTFKNPVSILEVDVVYRFDPDYVPTPLTGPSP